MEGILGTNPDVGHHHSGQSGTLFNRPTQSPRRNDLNDIAVATQAATRELIYTISSITQSAHRKQHIEQHQRLQEPRRHQSSLSQTATS